MKILDREFYTRDTLTVAKDLLGCKLVHRSTDGIVSGIIVETEAYIGPDDDAAHSARKRSIRTEPMYMNGGHSYVYQIYGKYYCFNIVTAKEDMPEAVLVRALRPIDGKDLMSIRRGTGNEHLLCSGPGRLCSAMGITKKQNALDLTNSELFVEPCKEIIKEYAASKRIGIDYAVKCRDYLWRFSIKDSVWVSKKPDKDSIFFSK